MKKNWIMRSAYLVLAVLLISTVAVSGTFAKYTWNSGDITDSAKVAKFAFAFGSDVVDDANDTVTIDLFNTILDTNETDDNEHVDGEADVKEGLIAPGVQGAFTLNFTNEGEVSVAVSYAAELETSKVTVEEVEYAIPLEFRVGTTGEWSKDIATLISDCDATFVDFAGGSSGVNYSDATIQWRWAFTGDDAVDTAFGFGANAGDLAATLTIDITVDQID